MRRLRTWRARWNRLGGATGLASRITGRCGAGRGWTGSAESGKTATRGSGALLREVVQMRREPKYLPHDRWHIERWMPAESYGSPEEWAAQTGEFVGGRSVAALGPYPARGDYEHCFTVQGPGGEFVQLTPAVARHVARAIEFGRAAGRADRKVAIEERLRREEREWDRDAEAALG